MKSKATYTLVWLLPLLCATTVKAQHLSRQFVEISTNTGVGNNIYQWNGYYGGNVGLRNYGRFYFTFGTRLNITRSNRSFEFTTPQPVAPVITFNDNGVWISSLNLALGVSCAITENLYVSFNAEILGLSAMSQMDGTITSKSNTASFSSEPSSTNIIFNPSNVGNLQNQLMLSIQLNDQWFLNVAFANQRSQISLASSLTDYGTFTLSDNAYFIFVGVQWRCIPIKKAP